jgi:hypothetical protein
MKMELSLYCLKTFNIFTISDYFTMCQEEAVGSCHVWGVCSHDEDGDWRSIEEIQIIGNLMENRGKIYENTLN